MFKLMVWQYDFEMVFILINKEDDYNHYELNES